MEMEVWRRDLKDGLARVREQTGMLRRKTTGIVDAARTASSTQRLALLGATCAREMPREDNARTCDIINETVRLLNEVQSATVEDMEKVDNFLLAVEHEVQSSFEALQAASRATPSESLEQLCDQIGDVVDSCVTNADTMAEKFDKTIKSLQNSESQTLQRHGEYAKKFDDAQRQLESLKRDMRTQTKRLENLRQAIAQYKRESEELRQQSSMERSHAANEASNTVDAFFDCLLADSEATGDSAFRRLQNSLTGMITASERLSRLEEEREKNEKEINSAKWKVGSTKAKIETVEEQMSDLRQKKNSMDRALAFLRQTMETMSTLHTRVSATVSFLSALSTTVNTNLKHAASQYTLHYEDAAEAINEDDGVDLAMAEVRRSAMCVVWTVREVEALTKVFRSTVSPHIHKAIAGCDAMRNVTSRRQEQVETSVIEMRMRTVEANVEDALLMSTQTVEGGFTAIGWLSPNARRPQKVENALSIFCATVVLSPPFLLLMLLAVLEFVFNFFELLYWSLAGCALLLLVVLVVAGERKTPPVATSYPLVEGS